MGGFKARERVSDLEYDFGGIEVADDEDQAILDKAKGCTPEPTTDQIRTLHARQKKILDLAPDTAPEEILKVMANMTEDQLRDADEDMLDMISEVTSERPSRRELEALPFRHRQAYYGWFFQEINNPSAGTGSTRRRSAPLRSA